PAQIAGGDIVVHCAALTHGTAWEAFERVNVSWTIELFAQAAARAAVFVQISSIAALGYANRPAPAVLDEQTPPQLLPGELYGRSKLAAEQALVRQAAGLPLRLLILRPGLIYGGRAPQSRPRQRGLLVDPAQRVPLVHLDSVCDALWRMGDHPTLAGTFQVVDAEQPRLDELLALKLALGLIPALPRRIGPAGYRVLWALRRLRQRRWPDPALLAAELAHHCRQNTYSTTALRQATGWQPACGYVEGWTRAAAAEQEVAHAR
ncbi:MAG TPA: NAD-dependent epimerase/dehydratase family protein, partial [Armatimonadota bacterium]|nr:NAD-dependent epimerase/dehydratase family protein [Armatimonadota bacterium]